MGSVCLYSCGHSPDAGHRWFARTDDRDGKLARYQVLADAAVIDWPVSWILVMGDFIRALRLFIDKIISSPVIVVDRFNHDGGADYPVRYFYHYERSNRRYVLFHEFMLKYGTIKLLLIFLFGRRVIINSLRQLLYWRVLVLVLLRSDLFIYLHETKWVFDRIKEENPFKCRIIIFVLKRVNLLCVSRMQQEWLSQFGIKKTTIVYNTIGERSTNRPTGEQTVVMVGSIQACKGVTLFSRVADLTISSALPCRFVWVGGGDMGNPNL